MMYVRMTMQRTVRGFISYTVRVNRVQSVLFHSDRLCKYIVTMAFGQSQNLHFLAEIFSFDILYLEGKSPLLMRENHVKFRDMLPETSKSSAFWDMGVNSHI